MEYEERNSTKHRPYLVRACYIMSLAKRVAKTLFCYPVIIEPGSVGGVWKKKISLAKTATIFGSKYTEFTQCMHRFLS
jgi:hypothetical protein